MPTGISNVDARVLSIECNDEVLSCVRRIRHKWRRSFRAVQWGLSGRSVDWPGVDSGEWTPSGEVLDRAQSAGEFGQQMDRGGGQALDTDE